MAIGFDDDSVSAELSGQSSRVWAHTVGAGSNRLLLVGIMVRDTSSTTGLGAATSVTFGSESLDLVAEHEPTDSDIGYATVQLWELRNPAVGADNITVTWAGGIARGGCGAVSLTGVDLADPYEGSFVVADSGGVTASPRIVTTTATGAGQWALDVLYDMTGAASPNQSGQVARVSQPYGAGSFADFGGMSTREASGAGSLDMGWDYADEGYWAQLAVVLRPATGGGNEDSETALGGESAVSMIASVSAFAASTQAAASDLSHVAQAAANAQLGLVSTGSLARAASASVQLAVSLAVSAAISGSAGRTSEAATNLVAASVVAQFAGLTIEGGLSLAAYSDLVSDRLIEINVGVSIGADAALSAITSAQAGANITLLSIAAEQILASAARDAGLLIASISSITSNGNDISGEIVTPDGRTVRVTFDSRVLAVAAEDRTYIVKH